MNPLWFHREPVVPFNSQVQRQELVPAHLVWLCRRGVFFSSALINHQMWFIVNQWFPKGETTKKAFKTCSFSDLRFHQGFGKCPNYWGFWTSFFESICWRLYPQSLGGVKNWDIDQPLPEMIQWAEDNKQYGFIVNYQFFISIVCLTARNDS